MQPYFLPYLGYWQLISAVDTFVVYDDIEFTKKGWINRNRYLLDGKAELFSLPLKKDSDYLQIGQRVLADTFGVEKERLVRKFEASYRKAPFYSEGMSLFKRCLETDDRKLFPYIYESILIATSELGITTELVISSSLDVSSTLKGQDRVIATCKALGASDYFNPVGGTSLYTKSDFVAAGIDLHFQRVRPYSYPQFKHEFVPHLSIIDVVMFNGVTGTKQLLGEMELF